MKKIFFISLVVMGIILFNSCDLNKPLKFNDKDAYVGFTLLNYSVNENYSKDGVHFKLPLTIASIAERSSVVKLQVKDSTAKEGVNYKIASSTTLTFTPGNPVQYIEFEIIEMPDNFTGDFIFTVSIADGGSVNIGSDRMCTVKIIDLDHPLAFILGEYSVSGYDYWDKATVWDLVITKDEKDVSKVWIDNLINDGQNVDIYGTVNKEKTEIRIPCGQPTVKYRNGDTRGSLTGWFVFYNEDGTVNEDLDDKDYDIPDGHNLIIHIMDDGKKLIMNPDYELASYGEAEDAWFGFILPFPVPGGGTWDHDKNKPMLTLTKK